MKKALLFLLSLLLSEYLIYSTTYIYLHESHPISPSKIEIENLSTHEKLKFDEAIKSGFTKDEISVIYAEKNEKQIENILQQVKNYGEILFILMSVIGLTLFAGSTNKANKYLTPNRLSDVLALIQVLALDEYAHRSTKALISELQGNPQSAENWQTIAKEHSEFFRVSDDNKYNISLVARHVLPNIDDSKKPQLSPEYTSKLLELALEFHDREAKRNQNWHVFIPIIVAITAGAFTLLGVLIKSALN
jgi:hypothetical protein